MPTVLIIDDCPDAQQTAAAKLEAMGFSVKSSGSAANIVEQVLNTVADVVFLDMNMPDIDGCEAAQILRKDERTWSIPIVMLSTTTSVDDRAVAIQAGCVDLISKPIDDKVVKELLSRILKAGSDTVHNACVSSLPSWPQWEPAN